MGNIYCSFLGNRDFESFEIESNTQKQKSGPFCHILNCLIEKNINITKVLVLDDKENDLSNHKHALVNRYPNLEIIVKDINRGHKYNPSNHKQIHSILEANLKEYNKPDTKWHFNLSSGTPAMSSMLLLYGKTHFEASYYQTFRDDSKVEQIELAEVPFEIELKELNEVISAKSKDTEIVGTTPKLLNAMKQAEKVALFKVNCLIIGETGTGKELIAKRIKSLSIRQNYAALNCSVLSSELAASELFGYMKGSFTGAASDRAGIFEANNHGLVFLDEIGDLSLDIQAQLLRALQEKKIRRIGGKDEIEIDVQVIAATNKNIMSMIKNGSFREDLYYRLATQEIKLEPLRDRRADIPDLIKRKLQEINSLFSSIPNLNYTKHTISSQAMEYLKGLEFPGNIRQLEHLIKHLCMWTDQPEINLSDVEQIDVFSSKEDMELPSLPLDLKDYVASIEAALCLKALDESENIKKRAAEKLGLRADTFGMKLKKLQESGKL